MLLVDESSTDDTYDVAREHADSVRLVEHPPYIEPYYDLTLRHARFDWVLWLDDDELMNVGFAESRDELLSDRFVTHFLLPYRWVIPAAAVEPGQEGYRWLSSFPWHPDPRLRLMRTTGSVWSHRGRLHSPVDIGGEGRVPSPDQATMYHLDLAWRTRAEREAKVARYRGHNAPSREEFYLYEDYLRTATTEPVPEPLVRDPLPVGVAAAAKRAERGRIEPALPPARVADETARIASFWENAPVFAAEYLSSTTPSEVLANRGYAVEVTVRNTSPVRWRTSGPERGRILLSYHWVSPEHGVVLREGDRSFFDAAVEPGETTTVLAGLWAPYDPGTYTLQWDVLSDQVNWFSERGVAPLEVTVTVGAEDRLTSKPRRVAELPPEPAAPPGSTKTGPTKPGPAPVGRAEPPGPAPVRARLGRVRALATAALRAEPAVPSEPSEPAEPGRPVVSGGNVVPIRAARVLDTRDGTGVPGAITGPVAAGTTITLAVAGTNGIPDYAVGIVGTLSIPQSDYNGFVNLVGGSGPPDGIVAGYFPDSGPIAVQVLTPLVDGKLSIWLSDNWPGRAHVLLDVTAFLTP